MAVTASDDPGLVAEITDWLRDADAADTIQSAPRSTIIPTLRGPGNGGTDKALAVLRQLAGASPVASAHLRPGEVIAEGGMGVIRIAEQVALGRTVAIKSLKPARRGDPAAARDLLREALLTGSVEHPNVVPIHHVGLDDDGQPMIVLRRIAGVEWSALAGDADDVARRFGTGDLLAWNLGILMQMLNAVRFAHSRGIVHRDLKPSNVMIGEFGEVYLLDWGLAVSVHDDGSGRLPLASEATELAGTPAYMAPEMLRRATDPPISERTDIYLAGAVLYELVTGEPPHRGDSALAIITRIVGAQPEMPPSMPAELARICERAMRVDPADRYLTIDELQADIQAYLDHRGSQRLADGARELLARLLDAIAHPPPDPVRAREEIHRLFGACRFGFHEALVGWRDNADARDGLIRATVAVAEHEIVSGDARAAVGLLTELDDPPGELLERARIAADAQAARHAELERIQRLHDVTIGTRTRTVIVMILGAMFVAVPLLAAAFPGSSAHRGHGKSAAWSIAIVVVLAGFGVWARESLMKTLINRRILASAMFLFAIQAVMVLGTWWLGISEPQTETLMIFLWTVVVALIAITIDLRLVPSAVIYLIAFLVAARWVEYRLYVAAAGNLGFTVNAIVIWRPTPATTKT
jgi:serine/threonine-protein kinase